MSPAPCDLEAPYGVANAVSLIRIAMLGTRGVPASYYIRASERWATRFPHRVVTDSRRVQEFYFARYGAPSSYIAEADVNRSLGVIHDGEQPRVEVVTDGQRVGPRAR